ncbi:hypothetical protein LTR28_007025, partial [Elasticomyces elasticus]
MDFSLNPLGASAMGNTAWEDPNDRVRRQKKASQLSHAATPGPGGYQQQGSPYGSAAAFQANAQGYNVPSQDQGYFPPVAAPVVQPASTSASTSQSYGYGQESGNMAGLTASFGEM